MAGELPIPNYNNDNEDSTKAEENDTSIQCIYNPEHKIDKSDCAKHYEICRQEYLDKIATNGGKATIRICPHDETHHLTPAQYRQHVLINGCPTLLAAREEAKRNGAAELIGASNEVSPLVVEIEIDLNERPSC